MGEVITQLFVYIEINKQGEIHIKYKLYENGTNDITNVVPEILKNRGIDDYETYLHLDDSVIQDYNDLDNIKNAVNTTILALQNGDKIGILIDEDVDGFCSAAMVYSYLNNCKAEKQEICYILHTKAKAHGLSEDVVIPSDVKLVIIPDAGTNDVEQCKKLVDNGMKIIILDHHEPEETDSNMPDEVIIVNNQCSKLYHNKNLCGAGVVYRFLQAMDDELWLEDADDYLDLCALANIGDVMDMRSFETKRFVDKGIHCIKNNCLKALIAAQDYSMNGIVNIHNIQWYIVPIINGMVRFGSLKDKELLFRAFIDDYEEFEYKKRATKDKPSEVIIENIYDRAARLCKNAKGKQDRQKKKMVPIIMEEAQKDKDSKITILDVTDTLDSSLTGLVAIKIAEDMNRPCLLLRKHKNPETGNIEMSGSARNVDHSPIDSLKDVIVESNSFLWAKGHANAFGCATNDIGNAISELNEKLQNIEYDATYMVDFILDTDELEFELLQEMAKLDDIRGQGIEDPMVAVKNITLNKEDINVVGKKLDTIQFKINEIPCVMFKCTDDNAMYDWLVNDFSTDGEITFDIVGTAQTNIYNEVRQYQIVVEDMNVLSCSKNCDEDLDDDIWN